MANERRELYRFGEFELDAVRRTLERGGHTIPLTSKALETLLTLVRNRDRVLTKDELMKALWPDSFVEEVNLAQNVSAVRKALGEAAGENRYISTIPGRGYRFVCEASQASEPEQEIVVERRQSAQVVFVEESGDESQALAGAGVAALPAPVRSLLTRRVVAAAVVLLVAALAASGWWWWKQRPTPGAVHALAVLPFQPLAGSADEDHLGLGIADSVITKLSNFPRLLVRPTDVAVRYSDPKVDPMAAARELRVDSVLTGKIQKSGQRLRVTVQLVRVSDGRPLWAETFDEDYTSIFAMEDSISERVAQALAVHLAEPDRKKIDRHYTENIEAYRNYLEGLYGEFSFTRDGMNQAIEHFNRAIAIDPGYALAYAGLADAYTTESDWLLAPRDALPKAESAARKALTFDDQLAEAHAALAHALLHEWRLAESEREFHTAIELNPGYVSTYFAYSEFLVSTGHIDEGIAAMRKALTLDPLSPEINSFLAWDYYLKRDYAQCMTISHQSQQMFPEFWIPYLTAGMCHGMLGNYVAEKEDFEKVLKLDPEATIAQTGIAISLARMGKKAEALTALEQLQAMRSTTYVSPAYVALVYQALGKTDAEFQWLEKAYDDRAEWLLWLEVDPLFDNQRNDPRLCALEMKVGTALHCP